MADIRALGYLPRMTQGLGDEYALATRFHNAKEHSLLSESQLAELAELPTVQSREVTLVEEIRALGHIPRCSVEKSAVSAVEQGEDPWETQ